MVGDLESWKIIVGIAATLAGGVWAVFVHFDKAHSERAEGKTALGGSSVTITALPPGAVVVMLAGIALVAWALVAPGRGDETSADRGGVASGPGGVSMIVENGVGVGGDVSGGSTVSVTTSGTVAKADD